VTCCHADTAGGHRYLWAFFLLTKRRGRLSTLLTRLSPADFLRTCLIAFTLLLPRTYAVPYTYAFLPLWEVRCPHCLHRLDNGCRQRLQAWLGHSIPAGRTHFCSFWTLLRDSSLRDLQAAQLTTSLHAADTFMAPAFVCSS
jgi:hypothetical protein